MRKINTYISVSARCFGLQRKASAPAWHTGDNLKNLEAVAKDSNFQRQVPSILANMEEWFQHHDEVSNVLLHLEKVGLARASSMVITV